MKGQGSHGFTLIELVLGIVVLGVVSVVSIPLFVNVGSGKVDAAARKVLSDLTYSKQLARNRSGVYGISFNAATNTYTVHQYDPTTGTSTTVTDPLTQQPMVVDFSQIPGVTGTDIQSATFGGTSIVRFPSSGIPQGGNSVNLAVAGSVVLALGGSSRSVVVQPGTGEVSVQ